MAEKGESTSFDKTLGDNTHAIMEQELRKQTVDEIVPLANEKNFQLVEAEYDPDGKSYDRHRTNWIMTTILVVAETASSGPLSNPSAVAVVGFVPGTILFIALGVIATYTAVLLHEFWKEHQYIRNYDDAGEIVFGRVGKEVLLWCQIALLIFFNASVIEPAADALYVLGNQKTCYVIFSVVVTVFGILISIPRTLRGVSYLSIAAIISWLVALIPTMVGVATQSAPMPGIKPGADIHLAVASSASFYDIVGAVNVSLEFNVSREMNRRFSSRILSTLTQDIWYFST